MPPVNSHFQKSRRYLLRARLGLWIGAALATIYLIWRFEVISLPAESCSPLIAIPAGSSLWIDRFPRPARIDDIVLFRDPQLDQILLGRIRPTPNSLPTARQRAISNGGAVWIEGDNPACPHRDSRLFGEIPVDQIVGRVLNSF